VFDAEEASQISRIQGSKTRCRRLHGHEGEFAKYLEDVYSAAPVEREALTDECEILVVGAGFAGLLLWYKLRAAGLLTSVL